MWDLMNNYYVLFFVAAYLCMVTTWFFYIACMHLMKVRKELHTVAKLHAYPFVITGVILDVILNIVFATVLFFDIPREFLLTQRLKRYKRGRKNWRYHVAYWVCKHLLNQFDKGHC